MFEIGVLGSPMEGLPGGTLLELAAPSLDWLAFADGF